MNMKPGTLKLAALILTASAFKGLAGMDVLSVSESSEIATVRSIEELRVVAEQSSQTVRMVPGVYTVTNALPEDPQTVFRFSGSDNRFDLQGVTIQIDTQVLADMSAENPHELATCRIDGSRLLFAGAVFEDIGNHPPGGSLPEFQVRGNDVVFKNCRFVIRGSAPYGYGNLYGKGKDAEVKLQKHSAIAVYGDRTVIESCEFKIHAYGHGIHLHGAQDTVIRNVVMDGELRLTDELYGETSGLAAEHDYKMMNPPWNEGQPIPPGRMLSLTEDGIRAYVEGEDINGKSRRTGLVTVENCIVTRMRGGIALIMASGGTVTDCTVTDCGEYAYSAPPNPVMRNCKGNAAYGPLLVIPYSNRHGADIELELIDAAKEMGDHPLARICGNGHHITFSYNGGQIPNAGLRPILVGDVGDRYTEENSTPLELQKEHAAKNIILNNQTPYPVKLTRYSSNCQVSSTGEILEDAGVNNRIK